ncbi:MAG: 4-hydroxy-3-methylbut-2-enyl diphosphate reductase, partial [Nitrospinota bacterium]
DATCPLVARVHGIIRKHARKEYDTIIIGEEGHPEVKGHLGYSEGRGYLVKSAEDVERLPPLERVCVVVQTTVNMGEFDRIVEAIRRRYPHAEVFNTICDATEERQVEARELAPQVDLMVVVGGRNSGNTKRLVEVCRGQGTPAVLVETEDELDPEFLRRFRLVGVTAGASTPNWMIRRVVERIESIPSGGFSAREWLLGLLRLSARSHLLLALSALGACYATLRLQGLPIRWPYWLLPALFLFSAHTLNRYTGLEADRYNEPSRALFYERYGKYLLLASGATALGALGVSASLSWVAFAFLLVAYAGGVFYSLRLEPRKLRLGRVMDFPASKTIVLTAGWALVVVGFPLLLEPVRTPGGTVLAFAFVLGLSFFRSVFFELRDIQGDRIVGKKTVPILLGIRPTEQSPVTTRRTERLLWALAFVLGVGLLAGGLSGWAPSLAAGLSVSVLYAGAYLFLYQRRVLAQRSLGEVVVEGQYLLAALVAFLWPS